MKKKIILCLISIFSVFIMIFSLTGCSYNTGNQDATVANFVQGTTPYETLKTFVTKFPDRTSTITYSVDKCKDVANWISEQFESFGGYTGRIDTFNYENSYTEKIETAYNVVYKKESASDKKVVIGAHYDNVFDVKYNNIALCSDGTYNNGVGVATLLELAKVLANKTFDFDIEFVAFGAEEFGWYGSGHYLNNQTDKDNIVLMINFDRNAIGDYVYMYSSEAKTKHNQFFYDIVKENNLCIADMPAFKSQAYSFDFSNYLYLHEANYADSQMFLNEGINIINFVSMNFKTFEVVESDGKNDIAYTEDDNFVNVVKRLGGEDAAKTTIDKQINSAISSVVYAFEKENFLQVMTDSKANGGFEGLANAKIITIVNYCILGFGIVFLVILYFVLRVKAKKHDVYINTVYGRVNTTTGKIEQNGNSANQSSGNVGQVFGNEFDSQQGNAGRVFGDEFGSKDNSVNTNQNKSDDDKTKDIFGDF